MLFIDTYDLLVTSYITTKGLVKLLIISIKKNLSYIHTYVHRAMVLRFIATAILLALLFHHIKGLQRIIEINEDIAEVETPGENNHSDTASSDSCCVYGNCSCPSLYYALSHLTSNVLFNIRTSVKLFGSIILLDGLDNISIVGHDIMVHCNSNGGIHFNSCSNCVIKGITWEGCGATGSGSDKPALHFYNSSSIDINNCVFHLSVGQALVLSAVSGDVTINYCNFVDNTQYKGHGVAIHHSSSSFGHHSDITIINCKFFTNTGKSVVYFGPPYNKASHLHLQNSIFYLNEAVPIYLSNQKLYIWKGVDFYGNRAENGGGIFISNHSKVTFLKNTRVKFRNNTADKNGGAIYLANDSSVEFTEQPLLHDDSDPKGVKVAFLFSCNTALQFGKDIYAYQSYVSFDSNTTVTFNGCWDGHDSGALYINHHSNITFKGNSTVMLTDYKFQYSGVLYIHDQSKVRFEGNTTVKFYDNAGQQEGGAMYVHRSTATFKENCEVIFNRNVNEGALYARNSSVRFEEFCRVTFKCNDAYYTGGATYIEQFSVVIFEGNSTIVFDNNIAVNNGGAMLITDHSIVSFEGNSKIRFHNNSAHGDGGAMSVGQLSSITFGSNSTVTFSNNTAKSVGGAFFAAGNSIITFKGISMANFSENFAINGAVIYSHNSHVTFEETCIITLSNNKVDENGGAVYVTSFSTIIFAGNSMITFNRNTASTDGGAVYIKNATVTFASNSKVFFHHNIAQRGGAIYLFHSCSNSKQSIQFTGSSVITFSHNKANDKGGAVCVDGTDSTNTKSCNLLNLKKNSEVTFTNNTAINGGAVYVGYNSNMLSEENSKLSFNANQAHIGGAIYSYSSDMTFQGRSIAMFNNNFALQDGGVVFSYRLCNISFVDNSTAVFERNKAVNGGAVHVGYKINIVFKGNSISTFKCNQAYNGGGIYSYVSNITFQENSTVIFKNNVAFQSGGALYLRTDDNFSFTKNYLVTFAHDEASQGEVEEIAFSSVIKFKENCKVMFTENEAIEYGGVIHSSVNSSMLYDEQAYVIFQSNKAKSGGAVSLHKSFLTTRINSKIIFKNNSAQMGGAVYNSLSNITFAEASSVSFIENTALQDGGAVYLSDHSKFILTNNTTVIFSDNFASDDGIAIYVLMKDSWLYFNTSRIHFKANSFKKSVYINVPKSCNKNCLFQRVVNLHKNVSLPVVTSPKELILHDPVKCISTNNTECNTYYITDIMLGQELKFNACIVDYYYQPTEVTQLSITGINQEHYNVSAKYISISCDHTTQGVSITGNMNTVSNYSMLISMYAERISQTKIISINLIVELSKCHLGFWYSNNTLKCECYNTNNIVSCSSSSSTIKRGYWFGSVDGKSTITSCPSDYCNFTCCEITNGIYHLSPVRANQCRSHRSGIACGACETGYTLTFDSPECIEVNKCTTGQTVLVTGLSFLYWIAVMVVVFVMMHFKIGIGSLYAIIYYYSVVDILLRQASFVSNGLHTTINTLSSLAKLTPQFLGKLCLMRNMSGIDQQFIHYVHPIIVSLLLVVISTLARRSRRISLFISRGIIHFICFLLLLSYTSVATTSLLLMRSMTFMNIHKVYTYLSPDVEYFHGRHLAYVIVAVIFILLVVVSLPLLLLLEPFLNGKVNFIKIKPLLDQFQGGYKDKYRYFAAYYLICRIVIIALMIAGSSDNLTTHYMLIAACAIIALVHLTVRPYADRIHNIFDGIVLQVIVITSVLPVIEYVDNYNEILVTVFAYLCTFLPLISFVIIKLWINESKICGIVKSLSIKYLHKYQAIPNEDVEIPPITETDATTDSNANVIVNTTVIDL